MSDATAAQVDTQHTPDHEAMHALQQRINEMHSDLTKVAQTCAMPIRIMPRRAPNPA